MGYSKLVDKIAPPTTRKWTTRLGASITRVIVHHWAGTSMGGYHRLITSKDKASANYLILNDGSLIGSVDERYRAWTSGSWSVDRRSITVEIQDETGSPTWRISDAALRTLVALVADVADRYRWAAVTDSQVRGHRDFAATSCPGPYLYPRLDEIADDAQAAFTGDTVIAPRPSNPKPAKPAKKVSYEWPGVKLRVDGDFGPITRRAYQRLLAGIDLYTGRIDGKIGTLTVKAEQRWLRQLGYNPGPVDGVRGTRTISALQSFLYDKGDYRRGRYSKAALVDGSFGAYTVRGLQRYLNSQRKYYK